MNSKYPIQRIDLDGDPLFMDMNEAGEILMTGAATYAYRGEITPEMLSEAAA